MGALGHRERWSASRGAGLELGEQRRGPHAHGPVLVLEGLHERARRLGGAEGREGFERRRPRRVRPVGERGLVGLAQEIGAALGLQRPELSRHRRPNDEVRIVEPLHEHRAQVAGLQARERAQHRRDDALVLVLQHGAQAVGRLLGGQRAERLGERRADAPVAIGLEPREHDHEALLIDGGGGAERGRAQLRPLVGPQILHRRQPVGRAHAPEGLDGLQADVRVHGWRASQPRQRGHRIRCLELGQGADRRDRQLQPGLRGGFEQGDERLHRGRVLEGAEAARGERAREAPVRCEQLQQRGRRPWVLDALERVGNRPPRCHQRVTGWLPVSTAPAIGSYAFRRTSAKSPSLKASASGAIGATSSLAAARRPPRPGLTTSRQPPRSGHTRPPSGRWRPRPLWRR